MRIHIMDALSYPVTSIVEQPHKFGKFFVAKKVYPT